MSSSAASSSEPFKSLFLPLAAEESAVFADVCTFLSLRSGAAAAQSPAPNPRSSTTYSPAEGSDSPADEHVDAAPRRSALFAVLSGRADGVVAVLRTREVVFFSLSDKKRGPVEVSRFGPLPSMAEAQTGTTSAVHRSHAASAQREAVCASLFPMALSYLCRVDGKRAAGGGAGGEPFHLRGVVGGKDGRVYVFSESHYAFSFDAHDCPVASVSAAYCPSAEDAAQSSPAASATASRPRGGPRTLQHAVSRLSIVSCGVDGTVLVWCPTGAGLTLKPQTLTTPAALRRGVALCVHQPSAAPWLLGKATFADDASEPTAAAETDEDPVLPTAVVLYPAPGVHRQLRSELIVPRAPKAKRTPKTLAVTASADLAARGASVYDYDIGNPILHGTSVIATNGDLCVFSHDCKLHCFSLDYAKPSGEVGDAELLPWVHDAREAVFAAKDPITHVAFKDGLCVVGCSKGGAVYVLQVPSFSLLGQFLTFDCRPIASLTLYPAARMFVVVDATCGSAEMVQVQQSAVDKAMAKLSGEARVKESYAAVPAAVKYLPTAVALRYCCQMEALEAECSAASASTSASKGARARGGCQDELRTCEEALLLSSMEVSTSCEHFLHKDSQVL